MFKKTESDHYEGLFNSNKNNLKKCWNIIKTVIRKKNSKVTFDEFIKNDSTVSDEKIIAENFNKFYVNIGSNLCKKNTAC